jgi:hypothetical protein
MTYLDAHNMDASGNRIAHIEYAQDLENKLSSIKLDTWSPYTRHVLLSVELTDLKEGDFLIISSEHQVTNDTGINLQNSSLVILGETPASTLGDVVIRPKGYNIDQQMHHGIITHSRTYRVSKSYAKVYLNLVVYAASDAAKPEHTLRYDRGQSHLDVVVIKIDERAP